MEKENSKLENSPFSKMPSGVILLIVATSVELFREIYSYFTQYNLFFGFYATGVSFNIINTLLLLFSAVVLFALVTMSGKLLNVVIAYYIVMISNYLFVIINSGNLSLLTQIKSSNILFLHSVGILLFLLTLWYLNEKKTLFIHKKDDSKSVDNLFVIVYMVLFVFMIILSFAQM